MENKNEMEKCESLTDVLRKNYKIMIRGELVEDYKGNCHVNIRLPDGQVAHCHLNDLQTHDLKPYVSWEKELVDDD